MTSLALLQLVSPALPVGAFSYSEGLEVLIQSGTLADENALLEWLELGFCAALLVCVAGGSDGSKRLRGHE